MSYGAQGRTARAHIFQQLRSEWEHLRRREASEVFVQNVPTRGDQQTWFDRLCATLALSCPRRADSCTQDFIVEFTGTWPGEGRCKTCDRKFAVSETGFKDRHRTAA
jgi:hypothetical protein